MTRPFFMSHIPTGRYIGDEKRFPNFSKEKGRVRHQKVFGGVHLPKIDRGN
jgi:hypothetical protein